MELSEKTKIEKEGGGLIARLLSKIRVDENTGCWNWTAAITEDGYGRIKIAGNRRFAHRISYELHNGAIPVGVLVCHECDDRTCINPRHLFLGTQADNVADMVAKGRQSRGDSHARAKLTSADVAAIRASQGASRRELAKRYSISIGYISAIRSGRARTPC